MKKTQITKEFSEQIKWKKAKRSIINILEIVNIQNLIEIKMKNDKNLKTLFLF